MDTYFKIVNSIFPTLQVVIAVLALVAAVFNFSKMLKLKGQPKAGIHLACAIIMLLLAVYLLIWLYRVFSLGFQY